MSATSLSGIFPLRPLSYEGGPLGAGDHFATPGPILAIPDLGSRPRQRVDIERLYIPVAVETFVTDPTKSVTQAAINLSATIRGGLLWGYSTDAPLTPYSPNPQFSAGSFIIAEDLVNPMTVDVSDQVEIGFEISFNEPTANFGGANTAWTLALGFKLQGSTALIPAQGAAYYSG